jgi:hypothetical protein
MRGFIIYTDNLAMNKSEGLATHKQQTITERYYCSESETALMGIPRNS